MKEYPLSQTLFKSHKRFLVLYSISFLLIITSWLSDPSPRVSWFSVLLEVITVSGYVYLLIYHTVSIREPAIKVNNDGIEIKIDQGFSYWKTTWANLSHVEVRTERIDNIIGDRNYEYVCFKEPVFRNISILGMNPLKVSRKGFRLAALDESAQTEIKRMLS
jgi:hypothetical protein